MSQTPGIPGSQPESQPGYGTPYGQPPYGQPYGQVPYGYGAPKHSSATTALVLGIVSLGVGMMCGVGFLLAPFAWWVGAKAVREIDASQGQLSGRSEANAGKIMGIIGTVLLALGLLFVAAYIAFFAAIFAPAFV